MNDGAAVRTLLPARSIKFMLRVGEKERGVCMTSHFLDRCIGWRTCIRHGKARQGMASRTSI